MNNLVICSILAAFISVVVAIPTIIQDKYDCQSIIEKARVSNVDWSRYLGKWYELYRSQDFYFDHGCSCTTADYSLKSDGSISVDNSCYRKGNLVSKIGTAQIVGNSSLSVKFGLIGKAGYEVIYLSDDYQYAGVLSCSNIPIFGGLNIWILSRDRDGAYNPDRINDVFHHLNNIGLKTYTDSLVQTNQTHCSNKTVYQLPQKVLSNTRVANFDINNLYPEYYIHGTTNNFVEVPNCGKMSFIHYPPESNDRLSVVIDFSEGFSRKSSNIYNLETINDRYIDEGIIKFSNKTLDNGVLQVVDSTRNEKIMLITMTHELFNHVYFLSIGPRVSMNVLMHFVDVAQNYSIPLTGFKYIPNKNCVN